MMDLGALLKAFIFLISSSLLYPVLFLLVILTLFTIVYAGSFFAEWLERVRLKQCTPQNCRLYHHLRPDGGGTVLVHVQHQLERADFRFV